MKPAGKSALHPGPAAPPPPLAGSVLDRDAGLLWHPYSTLGAGARYEVQEAEGVWLNLADASGRYRVIDGMSSWWSAVHGYRHPRLDTAARKQLEQFSHVMFGGLTHAPAVELAERLTALTPGSLNHVFLADSGSICVEVALKLALQYQHARGQGERQRVAALRGGYHGDTFATMGICDPVDGMHAQFSGQGPEHVFLPRPPSAAPEPGGGWQVDETELSEWETQARAGIAAHSGELAAIICEPVLQGAGGMHVYAPQVLGVLRQLADEHGLLLIFDEIATGFGRTGRLFASQWAGVIPDIMCVGKALTGGYLSLAATLCTTAVAQTLERSGSPLLHGPTFMGNPLACAVANGSLRLLSEPDPQDKGAARWQGQVNALQDGLRRTLGEASGFSSVRQVRVLGGVGVIQLREPVRMAEVTAAAVRRGAWVRPFRDLLYVMPPYVTGSRELEQLGQAVVAAVGQVHGR